MSCRLQATAPSVDARWRASPDFVVGELARSQSQVVPGAGDYVGQELAVSPRVDRLQDILPGGAAADVPRLSPVEASARYLRHMLSAFCHERACTLAELEVVLTVPASFDEVARELTVEAARRRPGHGGSDAAGRAPGGVLSLAVRARSPARRGRARGPDLRLRHRRRHHRLHAIQFRADRSAGGERRLGFHRTAVGDHILLGGDNMDLALARRLETQLQGGGATAGRACL